MIYVVTLEDTRLHRNGVEPTVTLHASSLSVANRVNELMLAYDQEFGLQLWFPRTEPKSIHYELRVGDEVFRIHVEPKELRS